MKFVIEIPDYMLSQLLHLQEPQSPLSLDDTIHMLIAKAYQEKISKSKGQS